MPVKLRGVQEVRSALRKIAKAFPDKVGRALYLEAQIEMTEAKRRTPVDTGTLRASGFVSQPERRGKNITVTMSFGGPAESYAIFVHENLDAHHHTGQAKFLESVINESRSHMNARLARRLRLDEEVNA